MTVVLAIAPTVGTPGTVISLAINADVAAFDAWWIGDNNGAPVQSPVPGWDGSGDWYASYQLDAPGEFTRTVLLYDEAGNFIEASNTVTVTIEGPPPPPQQRQPPVTITPTTGGILPTTGGTYQPPDLSNIPEPLRSILSGILQTSHDLLATVESDLQNIAGAIIGTVGQALVDILPTAMDALAGANTALADFVATLGKQLTTTDDYWQSLLDKLPDPTDKVETIAADIIAMLVGHIRTQITDSLPADLKPGSLPPALAALMAATGVAIPEEIIVSIGAMGGSGLGVLAPIAMLIIGVLLAKAYIGPVEERLRQNGMSLVKPTLPTPAELADAWRKGILSDDATTGWYDRLGVPAEVTDIHRRLTQQYLSVGEYMQLWLRGLMSDEEVGAVLDRLGFIPEDRDKITALTAFIPGPSDVVRFLIRDVFIPEFVERYQMDAEQPPDARKWFGQLGMSEEVQSFFWRAHWELPSIEQGQRMYWRGEDKGGINKEDYTRLLRAHGIEPFWREPFANAAYHPFTRIDVRRLRIAGLITQDDVAYNYRLGGYSPENADLLAQYVEAQVGAASDPDLKPWVASLKTHLITAYENGTLGEQELTDGLENLGYTASQVAAFVAQAQFVYTTKLYDIVRAGVKHKYVNGFIDEGEAATELSGYGVDDAQIQRLVTVWGIEANYRDLSHSQQAVRALTESQIVEAYSDRLLNNQDAMDLLVNLHYSVDDSNTLLAMADHRLAKAQQTSVKAVVAKLYVAGRIDRATATARLDAASVPPDARELLLDTWDTERESKIQPLPLGSIELMVKDAIMTEDQARTQLLEQGFTDTETTQLLAVWGVENARKLAKEQAAQAAQQKQLSVAEIRHAIIAGAIDETGASRRLAALHYAAEDAALILKLTPRELTAQQVLAALKAKTVDAATARTRLLRLGYNDADTTLLIQTVTGV